MKKEKLVIFGLLLLFVMIIAFALRYSKTKSNTNLVDGTNGNGEPRVIAIGLSEQNSSGESGTAVLSEKEGKVTVELFVTGAPSDIDQPAHIHEGSCPEVGGVKYPLNFPKNGESITELQIPWDTLVSQMPLAINVHKSTSQAQEYVSCGNLIF